MRNTPDPMSTNARRLPQRSAVDYVKLYTRVLTHPKWIALSPRAKVVITQAWMYAGAHETDGFVPKTARKVIEATTKTCRELDENGWWHSVPGGWQIHDWSDHQRTREQLMATRDATRQRVRKHREKEAA